MTKAERDLSGRTLIGSGVTTLTTTTMRLSLHSNCNRRRSDLDGGLARRCRLDREAANSIRAKNIRCCLIHGGPQARGRQLGLSLEPQIYAGDGYVAFMPNPRGSTGYGQKFVADISGDWGGKFSPTSVTVWPWRRNLPYIDKNRRRRGRELRWLHDRLDSKATTTIRDFITRCWCRTTASTISPA